MMRDAERLTEVISSQIAKLMDEHAVPPPKPSFWVDVRKMIRAELAALNQQNRIGE
jgi:phage tail sheath protein FI